MMANTPDAHGQRLVWMDGNLGWLEALPVFALLLVQVGLYVWMAPRGFEFSDESLYLPGYLYWRDLLGTVSFYAAHLEFPFRMLGQSVAAIRIFTLVLLLASSAFFLREALCYWLRRQGSGRKTPWAVVAVGMAASLFYFGDLRTLRAPSYNLLTLCSMLVSTGSLLRLLNPASYPADQVVCSRQSLSMVIFRGRRAGWLCRQPDALVGVPVVASVARRDVLGVLEHCGLVSLYGLVAFRLSFARMLLFL